MKYSMKTMQGEKLNKKSPLRGNIIFEGIKSDDPSFKRSVEESFCG
jgi:hypothetical protein